MSELEIDDLARLLAAGAGLEWDRLATHPGYLRTVWRERARALLASTNRRDGKAIGQPAH